jgi:peroxiredoxin
MKRVIVSLVFLFLVSACFTPAVKKGVKAPRINAIALSGEKIDLAQYRGKVILMNFWATWCGPCGKELLELEALQKEFGRDDFLVLAINKEEPIEKVSAFLAERGLSLTIILDQQGRAYSSYGVRALPTNILIDRDGNVRTTAAGYTRSKFKSLRQQIGELIAERY